ncbi:MAG: hypothetical protein ACO3GZ_11105, partial [Ilumatobacteraceae bacterium]
RTVSRTQSRLQGGPSGDRKNSEYHDPRERFIAVLRDLPGKQDGKSLGLILVVVKSLEPHSHPPQTRPIRAIPQAHEQGGDDHSRGSSHVAMTSSLLHG